MMLTKKRAEEIGYEVLREFAAEAIEKQRGMEPEFTTWTVKKLESGFGGSTVIVGADGKPRLASEEVVKKIAVDIKAYDCGRCGYELARWSEEDETEGDGDYNWRYCPMCGQKIDWEADR